MDFYISRGFFGGGKLVVLPNPVIFAPTEPKTRAVGPVRFLYLGQIEEHKGVRMLVKTFRHLLNEGHDNLELTVAGTGALVEEIKVLAFDEGRIKILGPIPHDKIGELFLDADYTIVPSLCYENSPTVIFESFSHGVPVLASNFGGIPEIIKDGVNGYLFNPDENSLKDAVLRAAGLDNFENLCHNGYVKVNELSIGEFSQKISSFF
jgi:glycosyltransferase involved in cell wall biosynthesis